MAAAATDGRYRRAITVKAAADGRVIAAMEDDFHHFQVTLDHRDRVVSDLAVEAVRHPWSLCPAAAVPLRSLVGTTLTPSLAAALGRLPIREHCTHMYDLACLAIVHAAKGTTARRWDMAVDPPADGERQATLAIDGVPTVEWRVGGSAIVAPAAASLKGDFVGWAATHLTADAAEVTILLRRAVFVSGGRRGDLDDRRTAAEGARNLGGCFVMRPGVAERAARMRGTSRRFDGASQPLGSA